VQVLTVLSFTALVAALPFDIVQSLQKLQPRDNPDQYIMYRGNGSTNADWPPMELWCALLPTFQLPIHVLIYHLQDDI
jgi:hypothetical protein